MARRSGLGRGLGALIPSEVASAETGPLIFTELPLSVITTNPNQPRKGFDEEALASLTASVRELGVLQPVLVRPLANDRYELIAGERRWRAAKRAGLPSVPAIVREVDDTTSLEQALVENLHRSDLNALEEAAAYQQLIEDFHLTHDQVAARVGKSRAAVSNTLRLFQLPPAIQKLVAEGQLSAGHARALLGTPDRAYQEQLARRAVAESLSVRDVEEAVRTRGELAEATGAMTVSDGPPAEATTRKLRAPGLLELEELFSQYLETRVSVTMGPKRGKVVIEFADLEDLERVYRVITGPDQPSTTD
ncbi:MAG: ParB family transcriptional regulator, chromosome partitioning protein [Acidimicrobiaceae bacterium]